MKYNINQLAIAAYWLVAGKDGKIDKSEYDEGWESLELSDNFDQDKDDWEMIRGLFVTNHLEWDEIAQEVSQLPLLTRYHINRYIVKALNKTKGKENMDDDSWPALQQFSKDIGVHLKAYNEWAKTK